MGSDDEGRLGVFEEFLGRLEHRTHADMDNIHIELCPDMVLYRLGPEEEWRQASLDAYIPTAQSCLTEGLRDASGNNPSRLEFLMITEEDIAVFLDHAFYCTMKIL